MAGARPGRGPDGAASRGAVTGLLFGRECAVVRFTALERGTSCLAGGEGDGVKQRVTLVHVFAILALVVGLSTLRMPPG